MAHCFFGKEPSHEIIPFPLFSLALAGAVLSGCGKSEKSVTAYVALDRVFSEPILQAFESETGIRVEAVYDVEASKTIGLVNRLIAEKDRAALRCVLEQRNRPDNPPGRHGTARSVRVAKCDRHPGRPAAPMGCGRDSPPAPAP